MNGKVSVIIPLYNQSEFIGDCIRSLMAQSYTNWEAIIINDGSTDNPERVIYAFSDKRIVYYKQENKGLPSARNKGLECASGEYIQFLDADDMIHPYKFEAQIAGIVNNKADISISGYKAFNHPNLEDYVTTDTELRGINPLHEFVYRWEKGLCVPIHCFLFKRRVIKEVGYFRTDLPNHEDWDFHIRTAFNSYIYCHDPSYFAFYRVHNKSMCRSSDMQAGVIAVMDGFISKEEFPEEMKTFFKNEILKLQPDYQFKKVEKHDLKNVTFVFCVRVDSDDRLRNLNFIMRFLHKNFDTNIIIAECDIDSKLKDWYPFVQHIFTKSNNAIFHRTKLINDTVKEYVKTQYFCNIDVDVFIELDAIMESVNLLKEYPVVYPYNGKFYDIPQKYNSYGELKINDIAESERGLINPNSYGGCIFFRTKEFIEGGMENENFISWSPEDCERFTRLSKLGFKIKRLDRAIHHFTHIRNINCNETNPYYSKGVDEYNKICMMSKDELIEYIKTNFTWLPKP